MLTQFPEYWYSKDALAVRSQAMLTCWPYYLCCCINWLLRWDQSTASAGLARKAAPEEAIINKSDDTLGD